MVLIFSSALLWSSVCLSLFLEEFAVESEHTSMTEVDRLAVISPVSEAQETNGEGTGGYFFNPKGSPGFVRDFTGGTTVSVLLLV